MIIVNFCCHYRNLVNIFPGLLYIGLHDFHEDYMNEDSVMFNHLQF